MSAGNKVEPEADGTAAEEARSNDGSWGQFNRFWLMQVLSQLSSKSSLLVFPLIAVTVFRAGPSSVGLVNTLVFLPVFVVSVFAGGTLDRWDRRASLIAAYLVNAALLLIIPTAAFVAEPGIWLLFVISALVGFFVAFVDLCAQTVPPDLVSPDRLVRANGRLEFVYSLAQVVAPGLAGVLVQLLGGSPALVVSSVLCVASAVVAARLQLPIRAAGGARSSTGIRSVGVVSGLRAIFRSRVLGTLTVQAALFNLFEQAVVTLYLVHAVRSWGFTPGLLGLTMTLGGLGTVLASVLVEATNRRLPGHVALVSGMGLASVAPLLIPLVGPGTVLRAVSATAAFFLYGLGLTVFNVFAVSLRQRLTRPEELGRVSAAYRLMAFGPISLGAALGGVAGGVFGTRAALIAMGSALVASWLVFAVRVRVLRAPITAGLASE